MEPVAYHITYADFVAFQRHLALRALPSFALFMAAAVVVLSAIAVALDEPAAIWGAAIGWLIAVSGVPLFARYIRIPLGARKIFGEYAMIQEEMTLSLTDEGFAITQPSGHVTMPWGNVVLWNETDRILSLHPNRQIAYILPKEAIGPERADFIRQRLAAHGLPRKGKRRT